MISVQYDLVRSPAIEGIPLYTTINRALTTLTAADYSTIVGELGPPAVAPRGLLV
jgi:hypothetical protein